MIGVRKHTEGGMVLFFKSNAGMKENYAKVEGPGINQTEIWFQARVESGLATFFYSLDGKAFAQLGDEVRLLFSGFTPNIVGFYAMNDDEKGFIDVDWFQYEYDGPKRSIKSK